jgi:hypothetical protein
MEPGEETDPDTLERLMTLATSFSLQEGEVRTRDLTLTSY